MIAVGTYFAGDKLVLAASGARPVDAQTAPQLMNVVQEMAIAANIPMPDVYIIDDTAPNAFATGRDPKHASIAITTGLLEKLDREELQGVIGHELSHVRNFDIRFALIVGVLVGAIALLADFFLRFTFWGGGRRSSNRDGWRCRPGDHLRHRDRARHPRADHRPVRPARGEPPARVPGRRVIGRADAEPLRAGTGARQDLGRPGGPRGREPRHEHMYFTNPIKKFEERSLELFSTHPAIVDRINRLRELTGEAPLSAPDAATLAGLE